jgi:NADH dehydrogenase FAD-containing subunit
VTLGDGEQIQTSTVIQAAGVTANGLGRGLGLHVSDHGRIVVNSRLQAADHPDVFASDLAAVTQPPSGQPLPMLAPVAIQSGRHAGRQVARLISGEPLTDFRYCDKGVVAVLGRGDAVAELPLIPGAPGRYQLRIRGRLAWLLWMGVHIVYLIGSVTAFRSSSIGVELLHLPRRRRDPAGTTPATRPPDHRGRSHACSCDTRCNERPWHSPADDRFLAVGSGRQ